MNQASQYICHHFVYINIFFFLSRKQQFSSFRNYRPDKGVENRLKVQHQNEFNTQKNSWNNYDISQNYR